MGICYSDTNQSTITNKPEKKNLLQSSQQTKPPRKSKLELFQKAKSKIIEEESKISSAYSLLAKGLFHKIVNFINATPPQINYSALKLTKYFQNQIPFTEDHIDFVDDLFPPHFNSIIGKDRYGNYIEKNLERRLSFEECFKIKEEDVVWLRPKEIFNGEYALFEGKIEFDDARQGSIGNCYFIASISALTECPQIIAEIFRFHEVQKNGYYEICLRLDGEWIVVIIDDYIPCSKITKTPIFARPKGHELWSMLIEKAWAKVNGGYINTVSGMASEVIECITNFPFEYNQIKHDLTSNIHREQLWGKIIEASNNEYIMTSALPNIPEAKTIGLCPGHEYTLEKGIESTIDDQLIRLVKMRNPWGSTNYKGKWSKNDQIWNNKLKEIFEYEDTYKGEGEFLIDYDTFVKYYADIDICKIDNRIVLRQEKINLINSNMRPIVYEIRLYEETKLDITLFKPYYRFNRNLPTDFIYNQHLLLTKYNNNDFSSFIGNSEGLNDCFLSAKVSAGVYFLYVYIDIDLIKSIDGLILEKSILENIDAWLNIYANEFFDFECKGEDKKMSILYKIIQSYNNKNESYCEEGIIIKSESNFFKSDFGYLYIKNIKGYDIKMSISLSTKNLIPITVFSQQDRIDILLKNNQEFIYLFTCQDLYSNSFIEYSYTFERSISNTKNTTANSYAIPEMIDISLSKTDYYDIEKYQWIYKKKEINYSSLIKQIDVSELAFSHLKTYFPKEIEKIVQIPKLTNHDELNLRGI